MTSYQFTNYPTMAQQQGQGVWTSLDELAARAPESACAAMKDQVVPLYGKSARTNQAYLRGRFRVFASKIEDRHDRNGLRGDILNETRRAVECITTEAAQSEPTKACGDSIEFNLDLNADSVSAQNTSTATNEPRKATGAAIFGISDEDPLDDFSSMPPQALWAEASLFMIDLEECRWPLDTEMSDVFPTAATTSSPAAAIAPAPAPFVAITPSTATTHPPPSSTGNLSFGPITSKPSSQEAQASIKLHTPGSDPYQSSSNTRPVHDTESTSVIKVASSTSSVDLQYANVEMGEVRYPVDLQEPSTEITKVCQSATKPKEGAEIDQNIQTPLEVHEEASSAVMAPDAPAVTGTLLGPHIDLAKAETPTGTRTACCKSCDSQDSHLFELIRANADKAVNNKAPHYFHISTQHDSDFLLYLKSEIYPKQEEALHKHLHACLDAPESATFDTMAWNWLYMHNVEEIQPLPSTSTLIRRSGRSGRKSIVEKLLRRIIFGTEKYAFNSGYTRKNPYTGKYIWGWERMIETAQKAESKLYEECIIHNSSTRYHKKGERLLNIWTQPEKTKTAIEDAYAELFEMEKRQADNQAFTGKRKGGTMPGPVSEASISKAKRSRQV